MSGTVAAVTDGARALPCADITIIVSRQGHQVRIQADKNGDYAPRMQVGKYQLESVVDKNQNVLRVQGQQSREFLITEGNVTRFDVQLDSPCPPQKQSGD